MEPETELTEIVEENDIKLDQIDSQVALPMPGHRPGRRPQPAAR
ncbi:MAG TPA: hypothetical protein VFE45_09495 [Coriobacteriia bacterium]|jgi:hypothetical protein|nr:hypothetical protein [Coriobacteriia bacterium]